MPSVASHASAGLLAMALAVFAAATPVSAQIQFEGLADDTILAGQIPGITFGNAVVLKARVSLNEIEFPPASGVNVAADAHGPLSIAFDTPVARVSGRFTYVQRLTIQAFDTGGALIATVNSAFANNTAHSGATGSSPNESIEIAAAGIARITVSGAAEGRSFALDDLTVTTTPSEPTPLTVSVVAPNGGEKLFVGVPTSISWVASGGTGGQAASFDVALSRNGGGTFTNIASCTGVSGALRACAWTPAAASTNARVRVTTRDTNGSTIADASNGSFTIAAGSPSITVTAPNTSVSWTIGSTHAINWRHNLGNNSVVRVDLSRDAGATWTTIAASVTNATATTGTLNWLVSGPPTPSARVRVAWVGGPATDISKAAFAIVAPTVTVTAPNTGVTWRAGDVHNIAFRHNLGAGQAVNIETSRDGGMTWTPVASTLTSSARTGTYAWKVTGPATTAARIRVASAADTDINDTSDVNFTIQDRVTLFAPATDTTWRVTSKQTIRWRHNLGTDEAVNLDVSRDSGITWSSLATALPNSGATTGSYVWTVSGPPTTQGSIRVSWAGNPPAQDIGTANLTIINPSITVTSPATAVNWRVGEARNITFTYNMGIDQPVTIEISRDGGATWDQIASFTTTGRASGTFRWTVSGPPTTRARIRVTWATDRTVFDTSEVDYEIKDRTK